MVNDPAWLLTVNTGSSSVRLACFRPDGGPALATTRYELPAGKAPAAFHGERLAEFLGTAGFSGTRPRAVLHRVVHGGPELTAPTLINPAVEAEIRRLAPLAPLHNPLALTLMEAVRGTLGHAVPQIAVFDTAFFRDLPAEARTYAIPAAWREEHGIRRYGFHGLAYEAMLAAWREAGGRLEGSRLIALQLGAGCSITAIRDGKPVDTSMGFSPLEGLVMATRSGDVDPGALLHLLTYAGLSTDELHRGISEGGGLAGLSGLGSSASQLLASPDPAAALALAVYCHRIRRYLGAFLAVLGGADAILFGGGVGENVPAIRSRVLAGMDFAGIALDAARNDHCRGQLAPIHADNATVATWVIPVDEATVMVRAAAQVLVAGPGNGEREGEAQ
jgi:acetate kinase